MCRLVRQQMCTMAALSRLLLLLTALMMSVDIHVVGAKRASCSLSAEALGALPLSNPAASLGVVCNGTTTSASAGALYSIYQFRIPGSEDDTTCTSTSANGTDNPDGHQRNTQHVNGAFSLSLSPENTTDTRDTEVNPKCPRRPTPAPTFPDEITAFVQHTFVPKAWWTTHFKAHIFFTRFEDVQVLIPPGGCGTLATPEETAAFHGGCEVAINAGFFNTSENSTNKCMGALVSNGSVVDSPPNGNAGFGILRLPALRETEANGSSVGDMLTALIGYYSKPVEVSVSSTQTVSSEPSATPSKWSSPSVSQSLSLSPSRTLQAADAVARTRSPRPSSSLNNVSTSTSATNALDPTTSRENTAPSEPPRSSPPPKPTKGADQSSGTQKAYSGHRWGASLGSSFAFDQFITGVVWIVRNGTNYVDQGLAEGDFTVETNGNGHDFSRLIAPRTAIGFNNRGEVIVIAIDGSEPDREGVTLPQLADIMIQLGAVEAVNLDGGGSVSAYVNSTLVTYPSDICRDPPRGFNGIRCARTVSSILCLKRSKAAGVARPPHSSSSVTIEPTGSPSLTATQPQNSTLTQSSTLTTVDTNNTRRPETETPLPAKALSTKAPSVCPRGAVCTPTGAFVFGAVLLGALIIAVLSFFLWRWRSSIARVCGAARRSAYNIVDHHDEELHDVRRGVDGGSSAVNTGPSLPTLTNHPPV